MKNQTNNSFKKSVLSIVVISAITVSLISWEEYQPSHTSRITESYQQHDIDRNQDNAFFLQDLSSTDSETLAMIAEANLIAEEEDSAQYNAQYEHETAQFERAQQAEQELQGLKAAQLNQLQGEGIAKNEAIIENQLLFAFDSSEINPDDYQTLNETAQIMKTIPADKQINWQVIGYADLSGNFAYNTKLAKKRAQAVAQYLVDRGVAEQQLSIVSLGASQPLTNERSIANNRYERRVEIQAYQAEVTAQAQQVKSKSAMLSVKKAQQPAAQIIAHSDKVELLEAQPIENAEQRFMGPQTEKISTAMEF